MEKHDPLSSLTYAVRMRVVLKYTGQLALIQAGLMLAPLAVSLIYGEHDIAVRYVAVTLILAASAAPWVWLQVPDTFQPNEALVVTSLAFLIGALSMVYPFLGSGIGVQDAFFEAISGITTTGLTTLADIPSQSKSFLFARAWLQWCGGLGILVLSLALLTDHHVVFKRLVVPINEDEGQVTGIKFYARQVISVYLGLTALSTALLTIFGMDGFAAVTHALCAVSTGGFSSFNDSIATMDFFPGQLILTLSGICGAISLSLFYRIYSRGSLEILRDSETHGLFLTMFAVFVLLSFFLLEGGQFAWPEAIKQAFLLSTSAQTTAGFSSLDIASIDSGSKAVVIASMAIGGEMGSTAGGIKIVRFLILTRIALHLIRVTGAPKHAVIDARLEGHRIDSGEITAVASVFFLFIALTFLSWLPFIALDHAPLDALFEVVSALGTVGLSAGISQPDLSPLLKNILCMDMLAGRLEIVALLVLIHPRTWIGKRVESI